MIKDLPIDAFSQSYATPYPGTKLFNYCVEHKLLPHDKKHYLDSEDLHGNSDHPFIKPHDLEFEDLIAFRKKMFSYIREQRKKAGIPVEYSTIPLRSARKSKYQNLDYEVRRPEILENPLSINYNPF